MADQTIEGLLGSVPPLGSMPTLTYAPDSFAEPQTLLRSPAGRRAEREDRACTAVAEAHSHAERLAGRPLVREVPGRLRAAVADPVAAAPARSNVARRLAQPDSGEALSRHEHTAPRQPAGSRTARGSQNDGECHADHAGSLSGTSMSVELLAERRWRNGTGLPSLPRSVPEASPFRIIRRSISRRGG